MSASRSYFCCVTLPAQHQVHLVAWTYRMPSLLVRI
jgi:hypothetical protein